MPDSIEDYRKLIEQPWGKMFYDIPSVEFTEG